jgi:hypothetical protein
MLSAEQNREQGAILKDFLKYSKMAEYNFKFTQATNYDTTKFKNSDVFNRKSTKTDVARDMNMFTSIDELLNSSSIGNQKTLLDFAMKSVGSIIKLEQEKFVDITNKVLESFEKQDFIGDDDFSKIASKAKASFLDFIIQTKSGLNSRILELTTGNNSIAEQVAKAKVKYPAMKLLQDLVPESSKKVDGAQTIKLKVNLKEAYDENLYVEMMRELRELDPELYNNIVKVALLQGTYQSPVSINNIIPIEDYSKEIKPIIDGLIDDADTEYFANGMFQKNNFKDEQIVPTITPRFTFPRDENFEEIEIILGEDPFGNDVYQYETDMFKTEFDDAENKRLILTLSPTYDFNNGADSDFVKIPRVFVNKIGQNVDIITGKTISPQAMKSMRMQGNTSLTDYYGYQKVKLMDGTPLLDFEGRYVYKLVNLLGDGNLVSEYYLDGRPSVLNNGTIKIDQEIADAKIIEYFGGDISEEIVSLPTAEVVEAILTNEEELTPEQQLEFEIIDVTRQIEELESTQDDLDNSNLETIILNNLPKITPESARKETGVGTGNGFHIGTDGSSPFDVAFVQNENASQVFYTNDGTSTAERLRIRSGGKVTIPSGAYGTSYYTMNYTSANAGSREWAIGSDTAGWGSFSIGQATTQGGSTFSDKIVITSGGEVQIKQSNDTFGYGLAIRNVAGNRWQPVNGADNNLYLGNEGTTKGYFVFSSGAYVASSDVNKKKDFEQSIIGLDAILGLKPTLYRMKSQDESEEKQLGFIAQEVKEFIPQAYNESINGEETFIGLNYNPIIAALVKAIQELNTKFEEYKATHP